jgi:hypothetical protein
VQLQLFILAYNLANFMRRLCLPKARSQPGEKGRGSIASFQVESFASTDRRGFWGLRRTARMSRGLLQGSEMDIDKQVPWMYYWRQER